MTRLRGTFAALLDEQQDGPDDGSAVIIRGIVFAGTGTAARPQMVAFARDVSVVSEEEYRKLSPPSALYRMQLDLASLSEVQWFADGPAVVRSLNDTGHLADD